MSTIANPGEADEMFARTEEQAAEKVEELEDLQQTREDLESTHVEPDGGQLEAVDTEEMAATVEPTEGFAMTVDRRAGSTHIDIEYADDDGESREERMQFGKPSGRASTQILGPVESMEDDDAPLTELTGYIWPTLAHWCLAEDAPGVDVSPQDPDFWADNMGLGDAIGVLRDMSLGGNVLG